jgi:hypothetical protein
MIYKCRAAMMWGILPDIGVRNQTSPNLTTVKAAGRTPEHGDVNSPRVNAADPAPRRHHEARW